MNKNSMLENIPRLRWACRRGMLELDLILEQFLNNQYSNLPDEDKLKFIRLLEESDPELFAWLMGKEEPADEELRSIVRKVRRVGNDNV